MMAVDLIKTGTAPDGSPTYTLYICGMLVAKDVLMPEIMRRLEAV